MILVISIFLTKGNFSKMAVLRYFEKAMVQILLLNPPWDESKYLRDRWALLSRFFILPNLGYDHCFLAAHTKFHLNIEKYTKISLQIQLEINPDHQGIS